MGHSWAAETIKFVGNYCEWYRKLFPEVRSYEAFKYLHVGMISDIKRKTLPAISRVVGLSNEQGLLHFLTDLHSVVHKFYSVNFKLSQGLRPYSTNEWR